jgi:hypothetical protein
MMNRIAAVSLSSRATATRKNRSIHPKESDEVTLLERLQLLAREESNKKRLLLEQKQMGENHNNTTAKVEPPTSTVVLTSPEPVNEKRTTQGLPALSVSEFLNELAADHAELMAREGLLFHSFHSELHFQTLLGGCHFVGESISRGKSVAQIHNAVVQSTAEHWENLISLEYTRMGAGTFTGKDGRLYMCQLYAGDRVVVDESNLNKKNRGRLARLLGSQRLAWFAGTKVETSAASFD